jgi:hypothetical protein
MNAILLLLVAAAFASPNYIPIVFTTPHTLSMMGMEVQILHLPLCPSVAGVYNGLPLDIQMASPFQQWNPQQGVFVQMNVFTDPSFTDNVCSTSMTGATNCTFTYKTNMTDLYLQATVGNVASLTFTVQAEFLGAADYSQYLPDADNTYDMSGASSDLDDGFIEMAQFFQFSGSVATSAEAPLLTMALVCPPASAQNYIVRTSIQGTNAQSAFSSYMCFHKSPCYPGTFPPPLPDSSSPTGSGYNFLGGPSVPIPSTYTNISYSIYGYGLYGGMNSFVFSTSVSLS